MFTRASLRVVPAALISLIVLWQAGYAAPQQVAAADPSGYVDCGFGFVCNGDGGTVPPGPITVSGPEDRVVQQLGDPQDPSFVAPVNAWGFLETEARAFVAAVHQVDNDSRVSDWGRDEIRAYILARLLDISKKPAAQRTAQEQTAYDTLQTLVHKSKVRAAQNALDEYNRWHASPCTYGWPDPLTGADSYYFREGVYGPCVDPNIGLYTSPVPPTKEEFTAVGSAMEFKDLAQAPVQSVVDNAIAAGGFFGGLGAAAVSATIAGVIVASMPAVSSLFVTGGAMVIFPFAAYGTAASAAGGAAAGVGAFTAALGVASAVLIVVVCIVLTAIAIWQVVTQAQIPDYLQQAIDDATNNQPDLGAMAQTDEGVAIISSLFVRATMPDYPELRSGSPAAHTSVDPWFEMAQKNPSTQVISPLANSNTIEPRDWSGNYHSVYMSDGWFSDQPGGGSPGFALRIEYVDWTGKNMVAGVSGNTFIQEDPSDPTASFVSPILQYKDFAGNLMKATLHANTPPTLAPTVSGTFVEGQTLTYNAHATDPDGAVTVSWLIEDPHGQLALFVDSDGKTALDRCYTDPLNESLDPSEVMFFSCPWDRFSGQETQFTYTESGLWHVHVIARDANGGSASQIFVVNVANADPTFDSLGQVTPSTLDEGTGVTLDGSVTDAGDDPLKVTVDWGDGTTDEHFFPCDWTAGVGDPNVCLGNNLDGQLRVKGAAHPSPFSFSHDYTDNNAGGDPWPVTVTVSDDGGGSSTATRSATVANVDPTIYLHCGLTSAPGPFDPNLFGCEKRYGEVGDQNSVERPVRRPRDGQLDARRRLGRRPAGTVPLSMRGRNRLSVQPRFDDPILPAWRRHLLLARLPRLPGRGRLPDRRDHH